jgi:hypothetical protein
MEHVSLSLNSGYEDCVEILIVIPPLDPPGLKLSYHYDYTSRIDYHENFTMKEQKIVR